MLNWGQVKENHEPVKYKKVLVMHFYLILDNTSHQMCCIVLLKDLPKGMGIQSSLRAGFISKLKPSENAPICTTQAEYSELNDANISTL